MHPPPLPEKNPGSAPAITAYGILTARIFFDRRFFKLCRDYFASLMVNIPGIEFLETYPKSERDRKVRRVVFLSSIKLRVIPWEKSPLVLVEKCPVKVIPCKIF